MSQSKKVRSTSSSAAYPGGNVKKGDFIVDDYEVYDIKEGGLGRVYLCYDHKWGEPVALKTFKGDAWNDTIVTGFAREAATWMLLDLHPNIVEAKRVAKVSGMPLLILEWVPDSEGKGPSLRERLRPGGLDIPRALNFAIQFCIGMDYAYSKLGIIHRDIKPDNTLITPEGVLKITDFGLVATLAKVRQGSSFGGTPPYMSPEQCAEEPLDIQSDVYGFGIMFFEMLTGHLPFRINFRGKRKTPEEVEQYRQAWEAEHRHRPIPELSSAIPIDLAKIVYGCLSKHPADRPVDFAELRDALNDLLEGYTGERLPITFPQATLDADRWHNKGASLSELGLYKEALVALDRALKLEPDGVESWQSKGVTLEGLGRLEEALTAFDQAIKFDPNHLNTWSSKGAILKKLGKLQQANECFDKALTIDSTHIGTWSNKGVVLQDLGDHEAAIECFNQALALNNRSAEAWSNKGMALRRLGRLEEALHCQEEALQLEPRNARTWVAKGAVLLDMRRYEEALSYFERALQINPAYSLAWMDKGIALMELARFDEGAACFETALRFDPNNVFARKQLEGYRQAQALEGWLKQGLDLFDAEEYQAAINQFDRVLATVPSHAGAWFHKGVALGHLGQLPEAISCLDQATEHDPQNDEAWRNKAFAYLSLNLTEEALACYEEAIRCNPRSDAALDGKGTILVQKGDLQGALGCFRQACIVNPDNAQAQLHKKMCEMMLGRQG